MNFTLSVVQLSMETVQLRTSEALLYELHPLLPKTLTAAAAVLFAEAMCCRFALRLTNGGLLFVNVLVLVLVFRRCRSSVL
jgi:hypothetical protein